MNKLILFGLLLSFIIVVSGESVKAVGTYPIVDPNMVLYYHFNNQSIYGENDTHVYDFSNGHLNNGTVIGGALWNNTGGYLGDGAFEYNGSGNYINTSLIQLNNNTYSLSFWLKVNNDTLQQNIYWVAQTGSTNEIIRLQMQDNDIDFFNDYGLSVSSGADYINSNEWNFITVTYDYSNQLATLYINGVYIAHDSLFSSTSYITAKNFIGQRDNALYLNGTVDEFILWNNTLDYQDVHHLYYKYIGELNLFNGNYNLSYINNTMGNSNLLWKTNDFWYLNTSINSITNPSLINFDLINENLFLINNDSNILLFDNFGTPNITLTIYNSTVLSNFSIFDRGYFYLKNVFVNITFSNLSFLGNSLGVEDKGGFYSFNIGDQYSNPKYNQISNSNFTNVSIAIDNQGNFSFFNNRILNSRLNSIYVSHSEGINIYNNFINNSGTFPLNGGIVLSWINDSNIYNNQIYNSQHNGISTIRYANNINIYNNYVYNAYHHLYDFFENLEEGGNWINFSNNVGDLTQDSVCMYQKNIKHSIFSNFTFSNCYLNGISTDTLSENITNIDFKIINITSSLNYFLFGNSSNLFYRNSFIEDNNIFQIRGQAINTSNVTFTNVSNYNLFLPIVNDMYINITSDYLWIWSGNELNPQFFNLSNALIYNTNGSVLGSTIINNNDGNINITLPPNNAAYVLDNYKLNESETRANNPISISGTSTSKTITSSLVDTINVTSVLEIGTSDSNVRSITVLRPSGDNTSYTTGWTYVGDGIIQFDLVDLETGETLIRLDVSTCSYWEGVMSPVLMVLITFGVLLSCIWFLKGDLNYNEKSNWSNVSIRNIIVAFIFIVIAIAFTTGIADSLAGRCVM